MDKYELQAGERVERLNVRAGGLVGEAMMLEVADLAQYERATELIAGLKSLIRQVEEDRKTVTGPLNDVLKNINGRYKPLTEVLKTALDHVTAGWKAWREAERKRAEETAAKARAEAEAARLKAEETAEIARRDVEAAEGEEAARLKAEEEAARRAAEEAREAENFILPAAAQAKSEYTGTGARVTARMVTRWRVKDEGLIPREYWMLDTVKVGAAVRAGNPPAGIETYQEEVV